RGRGEPRRAAAGVRVRAPFSRRRGNCSPEPRRRHRRRVRPAPDAWRDPAGGAAIGNNGHVNQWKWVNHFQPQTLVIATFLCYIDAVFGFIFPITSSVLAGLLIVVTLGLGGFGIANEKRWGYAVAVIGAVLQVVVLVLVYGSTLLTSAAIISL